MVVGELWYIITVDVMKMVHLGQCKIPSNDTKKGRVTDTRSVTFEDT